MSSSFNPGVFILFSAFLLSRFMSRISWLIHGWFGWSTTERTLNGAWVSIKFFRAVLYWSTASSKHVWGREKAGEMSWPSVDLFMDFTFLYVTVFLGGCFREQFSVTRIVLGSDTKSPMSQEATKSSSLREITKSSVWPALWVGPVTCWTTL